MNGTQEIDAQGDSIEIGLRSNGEWTIKSTAEWITISPMSGNGDATLTLSAEANTTGEPRMAEVRAITKDNASVLTLTQGFSEPEKYVKVMPNEILCDSEGGEFVVMLSANVNWSVSTPTWIKCLPSEGSGDARITITIDPIDSDMHESREVDVVFGNSNVFEKVHVVQTVAPVLDIELAPNNLQFVCTGETKTMTVTTEDSWMASVEDDWVSLSQTEGQGDAEISVTVGENPIYLNRVSIVVFTTAGNVQKVLTILQEATPNPHFLEVSPREIAFGKEGGENEITISCDADWEFDLDCDWLMLSQLSGSGNGSISVSLADNTSEEAREAVITIASNDKTETVTIKQGAATKPTVTALNANYDGRTSAVVSFSYSSMFPVTEYGVCYNTTGQPTINDAHQSETGNATQGTPTLSLTGLSYSTTYYVRAYAKSAVGITYSESVSFTTANNWPGGDDNVTPNL